MHKYTINNPCSTNDFNILGIRTSETCKEKGSLSQRHFESKNQTNSLPEISSSKHDEDYSLSQIERVHVIPIPQIKHVTRTVLIPKIVSKNAEKHTDPIPSYRIISSKKKCFQKSSPILVDNCVARAINPPVDVASKVIYPREMNKEKVYCEKSVNNIHPLKVFYKVKHPPKLNSPHDLSGLTRKQFPHISMTPCPTTFCSYPSKITNLSFPQQGSTANPVQYINVDISSHPLYVPFQPKGPVNVIDLRNCTTKIVDKPCQNFTGQTFHISYPQVNLVCSSEHDGTNKTISSKDSVKNILFERTDDSINDDIPSEIIMNNTDSYTQQDTVTDSNLVFNSIQENRKNATPLVLNKKNISQHEGISACVSESTCSTKNNVNPESSLPENVTTSPLHSSSSEIISLKTKDYASEDTSKKIKYSNKNTNSLCVEFHHSVGFSSHTPNYLWEIASQLLKKKNIN